MNQMVPPDGIPNILSLKNIKVKYRVSFDSELEDGIVVHTENGSKCVFRTSKKGYYYSGITHDIWTILVRTADIKKLSILLDSILVAE